MKYAEDGTYLRGTGSLVMFCGEVGREPASGRPYAAIPPARIHALEDCDHISLLKAQPVLVRGGEVVKGGHSPKRSCGHVELLPKK